MTNFKIVISILIFCGIFFIFNCNKNTSDPEPEKPDQPEFATKSLDIAEHETGIDAIPEGNGILLEWEPLNIDLVEWVKIYKKSQGSQNFHFLTSVASTDSIYIDYDVNIETRYYYYLKSVGKAKVESLPSDTSSYRLLPKAASLNYTGSAVPSFSWQYPYLSPVGYLIRLEDEGSSEVVWISNEIQSYDLITTIDYNNDGKAKLDSLQSGLKYRWRVDVLGSDLYSGSESGWNIIEKD